MTSTTPYQEILMEGNASIREGAENFLLRHKFNFLCVTVIMIILAFILWILYRPTGLCFGRDGKQGTCMDIFKCPFAFNEIKKGKKPVFCDKLKVCCVEDYMPILDARHLRPHKEENMTTSTNVSIEIPGNVGTPTDQCEPLTNYSMSAPGNISFQKCLHYQDLLVYPCQVVTMSVKLEEVKMARMNHCNWKSDTKIIPGTDAHYGEFPHMALLGYDSPDREWQCSGFIVSDRFVLTAAHCTYSRNGGNVTKVRVGFPSITQSVLRDELYRVAEIHKHPRYKAPLKYDDIALLKTDRKMILNRYRVPACLHYGTPISDEKIALDKFPDEECEALYRPKQVRLMPRGYDGNTQICYGDRVGGRDSSKGDSGGPAQISHPDVRCMYLVTAIVSHGKTGHPGIYTRIAPYLSWIESIVWN
ncbi:serine protease snake-like isoform X2 [Vanessa cardui]|uniref:serine protease snake-like isoform X2 n=1 Tax=Vanessa cardui TaxID=171605 RepID=UPI001F1356E6|nr:serine protease snake-like isoform X2 [Vanessa cardui]